MAKNINNPIDIETQKEFNDALKTLEIIDCKFCDFSDVEENWDWSNDDNKLKCPKCGHACA